VEVFTKSGTNQYHGTLSEFFTNNVLSGRTIFQASIPSTRRNEYGFTAGGPIIKNKTFFFGSWYGLRSSTASTAVVREETPQFADFVETNFPNSLAAKFFRLDPPAAPPTSSISTVAQVQQSNPGSSPATVFPATLPAIGTGTISMVATQPSGQWSARVDHNLGDKDRIYVNSYRTHESGFVVNTRPNLAYPYPNTGVFIRSSWTHIFSPMWLNQAAFSLVRAGGRYSAAPGEAADLPNANITGIGTGFAQDGPYRYQHNNFIIHDGVGWQHRGHEVKFGVDVDRQRGYAVQSYFSHPTFQFSNILDFAQDLPFSQSGPTMDIAKGTTATNLYRKLYEIYAGLYVQDEWKAGKRLTINAGLRWEYYGHWGTGAQGVIPFPLFTPGPGATFEQQVASGSMQVRGGGAGYFANNRPTAFGPRIGLAWDVFGKGSTSIRVGYGFFHSRVANLSFGVTNGDNTNPPAFGNPSVNINQPGYRFSYVLGSSGGYYFPPPPGFTLQIGSAGNILGSRVSVGGIAPTPKQPETSDYTFSVQHRLGKDYVIEVDYLGIHSVHLYTQTDINRFAGDLIVNKNVLTRLNSYFNSIVYGQTIGSSRANIVSAMLTRRFARGLSAQAIFTGGRALDANSSNDNGVPNGERIEDVANVNGQWGRADFDIKKRLALNGVWEVSNHFRSRVLNQILGHWRFSGNAILQSGLPFGVYTSAAFAPILGPNNTVIGLKPGSGDYNGDGYGYDQPNAPSFGNYVSVSRSAFIKGLFAANAFPVPALGREGDLGRNTFDGPGLAQVNVNIVKTIHIPWFIGKDGAMVEIRSEIFNVLNRVNLNNPISDLSSGLFGLSTSQKSPRAAQFGLRIAF
jgi:hypothetical protein